jgi:hypothetical protein
VARQGGRMLQAVRSRMAASSRSEGVMGRCSFLAGAAFGSSAALVFAGEAAMGLDRLRVGLDRRRLGGSQMDGRGA